MYMMKWVKRAVILLIPGVLMLCGCQEREKPAAGGKGQTYAVVDSLLGSSYHVPGTGVTVRLPIGFDPAADSILLMLQSRLAQGVGPEGGVRMVACFLDTIHTAGLMISVIEDPAVAQDTTAFFGRYRQSLYSFFGSDRVREEEFQRDSVFRKIFMTPKETLVRVQCLTFSPVGDPLELTYFSEKTQFGLIKPRIESSIAGLSYTRDAFRPDRQ
jgi:hypothetical protein